MPTSIKDLEETFNLCYSKTIKWGNPVQESNYGIYIVSTSRTKEYLPHSFRRPSFSAAQIDSWLKNAPMISLNNVKPRKLDLIRLLNGFWLADESILYIGKAQKQPLSKRIQQFYDHKPGKSSPHKGGYWLKLLNRLDGLYIHLYITNSSDQVEKMLLNHFMDNVSEATKKKLTDTKLSIPFANLKSGLGKIKKHGLKNHVENKLK